MQKLKLIFLLVFLYGNFIYAQKKNVQNAGNKVDDNRFEVSKQLEIFNALVKEVEMFYVDSINAGENMRRIIDAFLNGLDPYTEYFPEDKLDELTLINTGSYGGIGALIRTRSETNIVVEVFANSPAALAGIKAGDKILMVDDRDATGLSATEVSEMLKGVPNTKLKVKIQRPDEKKPQIFDLVRKQIPEEQVPYYGVKNGSVGYIKLNGFKEKSGEDMKAAFEDLKKNHQIKSLVLDLRDNPGGILEEAVQMLGFFIPKGTEILSIKGKASQLDRIYRTYNEPIDTAIPLAVLINEKSASASEIVAGALQDMDRAVLIGQRSFGKGLVQSSRNLPYEGKLKITISKYFIPSGRCIQQLDYTHRNPDGSVAAIPDSLTSVFHTAKGRPVRDGGGIRPDVEVSDEKPIFIDYLHYYDKDFILFDYINDWVKKHETIPSPDEFTYSDEDYEGFKKVAVEKKFEYGRQSERALGVLKEVAKYEGFLEEDSTIFAALEKKLEPDLKRDLEKYKTDIKQYIASEIVKRYYYLKGETQFNLRDDKIFNNALDMLENRELYMKTLTAPE